MSGDLYGLPYYGGKNTVLGEWIAGLLPADGEVYVEAYGGMLGVLLRRAPASYEIVNDLDRRIACWWKAVRDQPDELQRWLACTPYSRQAHAEASEVLAAPAGTHDDLVVAGSVAVVLCQAYTPLLDDSTWRPCHQTVRHKVKAYRNLTDKRLRLLTLRLANVEVECCDAERLVERWLGVNDAVLYLDPPYKQGGEFYAHGPEHEGLLGLLTSCDVRARVALSGYPTCAWAALEDHSWHRHERDHFSHGALGTRTEVLWTNYETGGQMSLLG